MFQTNVVENITIHILCSVTFFSENRVVNGIMWKVTVEPDMPHDNMIWCVRLHAEKLRQRHAIKKCSPYCFSTARVVTRKRLNVMFIHIFSVLFIIETEDVNCVVRFECYIRFSLFFGFDPSLVCVGFVVDLVALWEVVLPVLWFLPVNTISPYISSSACCFTRRTNVRSWVTF
jgi:hypothetical protein